VKWLGRSQEPPIGSRRKEDCGYDNQPSKFQRAGKCRGFHFGVRPKAASRFHICRRVELLNETAIFPILSCGLAWKR
jgi:hypothetical protein